MSSTKKVKQISYISALTIIVCSTIGAGIFFKNSSIFNNAHGSLGLAIASWIVSAFGITAIGLALIEVSSASQTDKGILEWAKKFMPKKFSKFSANYMLLVYLPLNYVAMPIYAVMSIQDATNDTWMANPWIVTLIAFSIFMWFAIMGFFSLKASEKFSWLFTVAKFIPIIIAPLMTIHHYGSSNISATISDMNSPGLTHFSGWLGIMASIPAILFAYDGFYTVTSLKKSLKDEKKMGSLIAVGMAIITGAYLFFAILTGIYQQTDIFGPYSESVTSMFNALIFLAVLGIINGFAMGVPRMYLASLEDGDFNLLLWFKRTFRIKTLKMASFLISIAITILFWIVIIPVGIYGIKSTNDFYYNTYGDGTAQLYEFADILTNFTSLLAFVIIGGSIFGAILNRKTKHVEVKKSKLFLPFAWISVVFLAIGTLYFIIDQFTLVGGLNVDPIMNGKETYATVGQQQFAYGMKFIFLAISMAISIIPMAIPANNKELKYTKEEQEEFKTVIWK